VYRVDVGSANGERTGRGGKILKAAFHISDKRVYEWQGVKLTAPRPAPELSFLNREGKPDADFPSSLDQAELVSCLPEEVTDIPEVEPGAPPDGLRLMGGARPFVLGIDPGKEAVRE
jgi:hypothetical protein